ncbi:unnamed protein product [Pleuronectes platessa]|uniref:Uncharacterized protein n=1 Tax=Pleuronectes platessa TaxID=8262 RepID=A0A9N7VS32_PLEPL|nr:unnamed protein product [Pleuronectes platessa]
MHRDLNGRRRRKRRKEEVDQVRRSSSIFWFRKQRIMGDISTVCISEGHDEQRKRETDTWRQEAVSLKDSSGRLKGPGRPADRRVDEEKNFKLSHEHVSAVVLSHPLSETRSSWTQRAWFYVTLLMDTQALMLLWLNLCL